MRYICSTRILGVNVRPLLFAFVPFLSGCIFGGAEFEGSKPGECDDGADNDQDGAFDCDDGDCSGSPDCEAADADVDVDVDVDADADADVDTTGCRWSGHWHLAEARCASFEFAEWYDRYEQTRMVITGDGTGACRVGFQWTSPGCSESEEWTFYEITEDSMQLHSSGITNCSPAGCYFPGDGRACQIGDRAFDLSFGLHSTGADEIITVGLLAPAWEQCTLDLSLIWTRL